MRFKLAVYLADVNAYIILLGRSLRGMPGGIRLREEWFFLAGSESAIRYADGSRKGRFFSAQADRFAGGKRKEKVGLLRSK
jgi:hypothetical protein